MPLLPYLSEVQNASKKYTVAFKGLNYGQGTQDGEFADTYNLSTDNYPCITQRAARVKKALYRNPSALHSKGKLLIIKDGDVNYGSELVGFVTEGKKQIATIGNYIVIFPDKKYYRVPTEDDKDGEFGNMEIEYKARYLSFTSSAIKLSPPPLTFKNVSFYHSKDVDSSKGSVLSIGDEFDTWGKFYAGDKISISGVGDDRFNKKNIVIAEVCSDHKSLLFQKGTFPEDYVASDTDVEITRHIETNYPAFPFSKGDSVTITGCSKTENNKTAEIIIRGVKGDELTFDSNSFTAVDCETNEITIKRSVPDLDFICESNYRLWGTKGNTIYSSKWSDPINFKSFDGLAEDSYFIEVGSEGDFTGCIPYSSHICFFKENTLHKLYGSKPSNFQITTANVYGVQSGSEKSMQIVNEQLLYKGVGGVYSYTGGVPELISEKFGNEMYSDAVACCDGEKYYISMKQGDTWNMFAYDVARNIWLREDDTHAVDMTFYDGKVYFITEDGLLYYIDKTADRSDIEWGATFCTIHETVNERKGYSKFHLRMDLSDGAWIAVDIKTDNDTQWKQVYTTHNEKAKTVSIPILPTRCDSIDIRLRGKGKCTVKAFVREFTVGSDV